MGKTFLHILPTLITSIGMTSRIGRVILFPSGVHFLTVRIIPSRPCMSCSMRALFHMWRGRASTCNRATSRVLNLADARCCRTWKLLKVVRYYLFHRLQKSSTSCCRILNFLVRLPFASGSSSWYCRYSPSMNKCAGVNLPDSFSTYTLGL